MIPTCSRISTGLLHRCAPYRCISSLAQEFKDSTEKLWQKKNLSIFRTSEEDPRQHTAQHQGLFYSLPPDHISTFIRGGIPTEFARQLNTFNESCFMVRTPALEIFDIIRAADISNPLHKLLIYGRHGCGKTVTLAHVLHYAARDEWLIMHLPYPKKWCMYSAEIVVSQTHPAKFDLPLYAMEWLADFKMQNNHLLANYKTGKQYNWTKRDMVEENSPLSDVIDFGLNRGKFACDCIGVVVKEVKRHAQEKGLKVLIVMDGVNALFSPTRLRDERQRIISVENVTLIHHFRKLLAPDWNNSILVASVDRVCNVMEQREQYTPKYLLGKEGFSWLDPYIPIHVDDYSNKEVYSCLRYYIDRNWIQTPQGITDEGFNEFIFLSGKNPRHLMDVVAPW